MKIITPYLYILELDPCVNDNGGCDQRCVNHGGRAVCQCYAGWSLTTDGRTCEGNVSKIIQNFHMGNRPSNPKSSKISTWQMIDWCQVIYVLAQYCMSSRTTEMLKCRFYITYFRNALKSNALLDTVFLQINIEMLITHSPTFHFLWNSMCINFSDIDECKVNNGNCAQVCVNTHGSFTCTCTPGYQLGTDGRTCYRKYTSFFCSISTLRIFYTIQSLTKILGRNLTFNLH